MSTCQTTTIAQSARREKIEQFVSDSLDTIINAIVRLTPKEFAEKRIESIFNSLNLVHQQKHELKSKVKKSVPVKNRKGLDREPVDSVYINIKAIVNNCSVTTHNHRNIDVQKPSVVVRSSNEKSNICVYAQEPKNDRQMVIHNQNEQQQDSIFQPAKRIVEKNNNDVQIIREDKPTPTPKINVPIVESVKPLIVVPIIGSKQPMNEKQQIKRDSNTTIFVNVNNININNITTTVIGNNNRGFGNVGNGNGCNTFNGQFNGQTFH